MAYAMELPALRLTGAVPLFAHVLAREQRAAASSAHVAGTAPSPAPASGGALPFEEEPQATVSNASHKLREARLSGGR